MNKKDIWSLFFSSAKLFKFRCNFFFLLHLSVNLFISSATAWTIPRDVSIKKKRKKSSWVNPSWKSCLAKSGRKKRDMCIPWWCFLIIIKWCICLCMMHIFFVAGRKEIDRCVCVYLWFAIRHGARNEKKIILHEHHKPHLSHLLIDLKPRGLVLWHIVRKLMRLHAFAIN